MNYDPNKHIPDVPPANVSETEQRLKDLQSDMKDLQWEYMRATEWNLATLEELEEIKGTSNRRIERQKKICDMMFRFCRTFLNPDHEFPHSRGVIGRLMDKLEECWTTDSNSNKSQ